MSRKTLQSVIFATIIFFGACAMYGGLWYATYVREVSMRTQLQTQARAQARNLELAALEKVRVDTEASRHELTEYLLTDDGVPAFLGLMEDSARERNLSIVTRSVSVVPLDGTTAFEAFDFNFEVEGTFVGVTQFLALLETMPYQATITTTSLTRDVRSTGDGWKGVFAVRVTKEKRP